MTFFVIELLLDTAIEEEGDVRVFLGLWCRKLCSRMPLLEDM